MEISDILVSSASSSPITHNTGDDQMVVPPTNNSGADTIQPSESIHMRNHMSCLTVWSGPTNSIQVGFQFHQKGGNRRDVFLVHFFLSLDS
jgi:hypothetical protein